ncbi:MAG TPA: ATP-binding protein [Methanocorpusculum sp.]|nr:ATP-binding protein [Methanocorpusculum sp.]
MYIRRAAEKVILEISQTFRVLLVTGARQTGKTTLLKHLAEPERGYVTLDDLAERTLAKQDPHLFLEQHPAPVIIDEIQYAPELLSYIKIIVDSSEKKGGFWLTGSQTFSMMKNVSESLAGRVGIFQLYGLSQAEIEGRPTLPFTTDHEEMERRASSIQKKGLMDIYRTIFSGSMPEIVANPAIDRERFYQSYIETYLTRDINDLQQVGDKTAFYRFLIAVAARTGRMVIYSDLAKDADISVPTAKKWLSILVASNIVALVQPFYNNILKRAVKAPIMHFLDTGLCAYLLRWDSPETLERGAMSGNFFETFVFSEIYRSFINAGEIPPLYYYRDSDKKEIDLLIYRNNTVYPIEIKKSSHPDKTAVRAFKVFDRPENSEGFPQLGEGAVVCLSESVFPITRNIWMIPAWLI